MIARNFRSFIPLLLATSCVPAAVPERLPPLASDAEIDRAQIAPLDRFAVTMGWNEPREPFNVAGNVYYVGTRTVSSWLIATPSGHFLIDGVVAQSAPQIIANIERLGFSISDVRYLLNSHAHYDHAGGLAGLKRASGATMVASAADKPYLEAGAIDHGPSADSPFPRVRVDRVIGDGERLRLGDTVLTAHVTPGHSPGCTSWTTQVVGSDRLRREVFFHCSSTVGGQSLAPEAYPGMIAAFRATFARLRGVEADIFLGNHDNFFDLDAKRQRQLAGDANAFVDPGEVQRFNTELESVFEEELARQQSKASQ